MSPKPRYARVVIAGLGLLGGSLALALKKRGMASRVVAWGRDAAGLRAAVRAGLVDEASTEAACAKGADLVVLSAPFTCFESHLRALAAVAPKGCLATDVGSVKGAQVARWHRAAGGMRFVASHPMAGGEKTGWRNASADLFQGAACLLTPLAATDPGALRQVRGLWGRLGMRVTLCTPKEHDRLVARVSHFPHAAAFALAAAQARGKRVSDFAWAGKGWFDTSRVAASDPGLWADIFMHHPGRVAADLEAMERELKTLRRLVRSGHTPALRAWLARAADFRKATEGARR
ncbi:MAG TPA: prephenate dehydrogenase/arogenate dehydrogenase family protein [bacterium]|jgi:prephenate dehydrogenase|nr:prephenate dehydrogenase/arogenate dehydrogenase family protein [bacterium]